MSTHQDIDRERRLFELVRDPLFVSAADGSLLGANRAGLDLLGMTEAELVSRPYPELLHPDDREAAGRELAEVLAHGRTPTPFRVRVVRSDGQMRWVETQSTVDDVSGLIYSVVHDVTDREETFMDRLAGAFRDAPLGMALVAPGGAFLRVNSTLCRMLGLTEPELLAESLGDVVEDERVALALRDSEPSVQIETPMRHREGRPVVGLVSATLVRDIRGEPQYYVCQVLDMTERYEAQADLAANEAKLAEAQQIARMGSWEWEIASDRVTWSDELYRIYGVTAADEPGSYGSYLDKVHPDDRARVGRVIETAVTERRPWSLDYRIVRPDSELRMIHARGEVVVDENGRPSVVHGTCQDVTESHRVEDQLRAAEQLFRRAFDDAPIGMALIDLDGRWLRLNRSLCQMLGRTEQQLRTTELNELSHPEDRRLDRPLIKELLAGRRRSFAIEKRYLRADGTMVHALVHISLMHGDGERPLYFLCQLVDITERRRAEAERRASEERLQAIIDNSPALIIVKDLQHRYLLVNRRWEELFGVRADQAVGRTAEETLPASRRPDHLDIDDRVAENGEPYEAMMVIPEPDGEDERTFLMVKFPLRDVDGDVSAVVTIATDITERRRSAEERAELEHRLAQAQRLESVGQLAGGVAHDFNNLLSVILTCVGFATRELPADHPVRDDVEEIGRAADRAAALTRQLLMFSRREVVKPEVLDVGGLLRDLERLLNRTLSERIALRITVGPGLLPGARRPRAARAGAGQPRGQRARRHARRRHPLDRGGRRARGRAHHRGRRRDGDARGGARPRLRALLHHQGPRPGHGAGPRDGARHRHRFRRNGRHRVRARSGHQRDHLPARLPRGDPLARAAGRARRACPGRRGEGARRRGPGAGAPPGLPDPRGPRLRGDRGARRRGGARCMAGDRRARDRRRHAGHDGSAAGPVGRRPQPRPARGLHVGAHRGRARAQRRAGPEPRLRPEAVHARHPAARGRGRAGRGSRGVGGGRGRAVAA